MPKCMVCGKIVEKGISKGANFFCCTDCLKQFEDPRKPNTKDDICEFC